MYLYLVRHGQSVGNVKKLFYGWSDHSLTQAGREQARQTAEKLRAVSFTRCLASDLSRAVDTAAVCLAGREVALERCPALREQDMGELEDQTWEGAQARFGAVLQSLVSDWFHTTPPGGESPEEMIRRVGACVDETVARGEDTLMVAHNGSLSLVLLHLGLAGEGELMQPGFFFQQGAYTAVRIGPEGAGLVGFNL